MVFVYFGMKENVFVCQQLPHLWEVPQQPKLHPKDPPCPLSSPHPDQHALEAQQLAECLSGLHQVQSLSMASTNKTNVLFRDINQFPMVFQVKLAGVPPHPRFRLSSLQDRVSDLGCPAWSGLNLFTQASQVSDGLIACQLLSSKRKVMHCVLHFNANHILPWE